MKKTIILLSVLLLTVCSFAQELNSSAEYLKMTYPDDYHNTIRKHALEKWDDNYDMVLFQINEESTDLIELVLAFESEYTNIFYAAIVAWSYEGYETRNISRFNNFNKLGVAELITLHCQWAMVQYTYEKNVSAKGKI